MPIRTSNLPSNKTIGTGANNLVELDGSARLPAVDGSLLTSLPAGVGSSPGFKGASVYATTPQSIPNATTTALSFDSTFHDTNSYFSGGNPTRLTVLESGYYLCQFESQLENVAGGSRRLYRIRLNGGDMIAGEEMSSTSWDTTQYPAANLSCIRFLNANDYIEGTVYQDSGSAQNMTATNINNYPRLSITKIETAAQGDAFSGAGMYNPNYPIVGNFVYEEIPFTTQRFDTDSYVDLANNRFVIPKDGYYRIDVNVQFDSGDQVGGSRGLRILVNGSAATNTTPGTTNDIDWVSTYTMHLDYFTAGDLITFEVKGADGQSLSHSDAWITRVETSSLDTLAEMTDVDLTTTAPVNTDVLTYDGTNWVPGTTVYQSQPDTTTLTGNSKTLADTTSAAVNYTLPTGVAGEFVRVVDIGNNAQTNNITLTPQTGEKVDGIVDDTFIINVNSGSVELVYTTANGWIVADSQSGAAGNAEEVVYGTWTPTYTTTGTDFDSVVYDFQIGKYSKKGRTVSCYCAIRTTSVTLGSASGSLSVGGLPFTVSTETGWYPSVVVGYTENFLGEHPSSGMVSSSGSSANLVRLYYRTSVSGATITSTPSDLDTAGTNPNTLYLHFSYLTDD